jgi:regulator of replication initiation timing
MTQEKDLEKHLDNLWRWSTTLAYALYKYENQMITTEKLFEIMSPILKEVQINFKERLENFDQNQLDYKALQKLTRRSEVNQPKTTKSIIEERDSEDLLLEILWPIHDWLHFIFQCQMYYNENHVHKEEIIFICVRFFKYIKLQIEKSIKEIQSNNNSIIKKILIKYQSFFDQLQDLCKDIDKLIDQKELLKEIINTSINESFFKVLIQHPDYIHPFIELTHHVRISDKDITVSQLIKKISPDFED